MCRSLQRKIKLLLKEEINEEIQNGKFIAEYQF